MSFRIFLSAILVIAGCADSDGIESVESAASALDPDDTRLVFGADWSEEATGPLVVGHTVEVDYDAARLPECSGEINGKPAWSITAHVRQGGGEVTTIPVVAPLLPPSAVGQLELTNAGPLEMWFSKSNVWGCIAYDSDFQQNYHFTVDDGAPGWMGDAASVISRTTCDGGGPCAADMRPLADGFVFGTWARQRATIASLTFQVWEPGVTDWDNPDLWQQLDVQIHHRFAPSTEFESTYVSFDRRLGNNARYAVPVRTLDPLPGNTIVDVEHCPAVPLALSADQLYVEMTIEYYFTVNGAELRPAPEATFTGTFQDHAGLYGPCL